MTAAPETSVHAQRDHWAAEATNANQKVEEIRAAMRAILAEYQKERDILYESVTDRDGQYGSDDSREAVAAMDAVIDRASIWMIRRAS
jgi:hypothetical protein